MIKDERLNFRVTPEQKSIIAKAAMLANVAVSTFVLQKTLEAAEEILLRQRYIELPADKWDQLLEILDRPARVIPEIVELFSKPSILENSQAQLCDRVSDQPGFLATYLPETSANSTWNQMTAVNGLVTLGACYAAPGYINTLPVLPLVAKTA